MAHRDRERALERLLEISALLNSAPRLDEVLAMVIAATTELLDAETSSLLLLDEEAGELVFEQATGEPGRALLRRSVPAGVGIAGWVVDHGEPLVVHDTRSDHRFYGQLGSVIGFETRCILAVPMNARDHTVGVIEAINKREGTFDDDDVRLAIALAGQAAVAVENARLRERVDGGAGTRARFGS